MIRLPGDNLILKQNNRSSILGNIVGSYNLDLTSNLGRIRTTRTKLVTSSADDADLELPIAFAALGGDFYALTDDYVFEGGDAPGDTFTQQATDLDTSESNSDMVTWNGALYVSESDGDVRYGSPGDWTTIGFTTSLSPHLLEPYAKRLYITQQFTKVMSISSGNSASESGSFTLDLGIDPDQFSISMLEAATNGLWIGVLNTANGQGMVYFWNGVTENTPQAIYRLDTPGVIAGTVSKDENIPYIVDADGKLLKFNGAGFEEVARFPTDGKRLEGAGEASNLRFIHPNGMVEKDGKILILTNNQIADSSTGSSRSTPTNMPAGVWEYTIDTGLYHKYSLSYSSIADNGSTNLSDYGQQHLDTPGALFIASSTGNTSASNGTLLMGAGYWSDADTVAYGIFTDNALDDTSKAAYLVTTDLSTPNIQESWNDIYTKHKRLLNSADKVILKYRTIDEEDVEAVINWTSTDTFVTTTDISDYEVGDEVEITRGTGAGFSAHIKSIQTSTTTYEVELDRVVTGATGSGKARLQKWKYAGMTTGENLNQYAKFNIGVTDVKIALKVVMEWTGTNELYELLIESSKAN